MTLASNGNVFEIVTDEKSIKNKNVLEFAVLCTKNYKGPFIYFNQ